MSHRYHAGLLTAALTGFVFVAAAVAQKVDIKTNQAPNTDFKVYKTYAWLPPVPVVKNVAPDETVMGAPARDAAEYKALLARLRELSSSR